MKKYLLLFLMCVYASIGAWAEVTASVDGTVATFTVSSGGMTYDEYNNPAITNISAVNSIETTEIKIVSDGCDVSQTILTQILNSINNKARVKRLDLYQTTGLTTADITSLPNLYAKTFILPKGQPLPSQDDPRVQNGGCFNPSNSGRYIISTPDTNTGNIGILFLRNSDWNQYNESITDAYLGTDYGATIEYCCAEDFANYAPYTGWYPYTEEVSSLKTNYPGRVEEIVSHDPYTVDGCTITINMANAGEKTFAELLDEAKKKMTEEDDTQTSICTLIVQGEVSNTELEALNNDNYLSDATKIDLSGATVASGSSIDNITLPSLLEELVLPKGILTISDALKSKFAQATNLWYAYSPTSQEQTRAAQTTSPDLVWVNKSGGLNLAICKESKLRTGVYVKVESTAALNADDIDLGTNKYVTGYTEQSEPISSENYTIKSTAQDATDYGWQYVDFSGANLQQDVCLSYTKPHEGSYRIIMPDGWSGDQLAILASLGSITYGGLAAVYSYTAQGFLQILEINDTEYKREALADNRIVRGGTKAVRVVSGEYNGEKYGVFGQLQADATKNNLFAAINGAASSIEAVTITDVRTATNEPLKFTNENLIYIQLDRVKSMYNQDKKTDGPIINVDGCTKLQTLNLLNSVLASVDASVNTLTSVDMSGTTVVGTTDLSTSPITNIGFVTNSDTWFKDDLDLSKTALTTFTTTAKVGTTTANTGDIILNENELTNVSLNQVQFQNTTSKIYVRKAATDDPSTTEVDETKVLTGTLGVNSIIVPTGFASSTRIDPYIQTAIKEQEYVAPAYVFSATDMYLHEKETGETPDKFVYWYTGTLQNNKVLTITMTDERRGTLATLLGSDNANITSSTDLVRFKIVGPLASNDLAALASVNAQILDLSEATLQKETSGSYEADNTILNTGAAINSYAKFLILPPSMITSETINNTSTNKFTIANSALSTGFTGLYSAIALTDYNTSNNFDFVAYNKVRGTLQPAVVAAGRGTINGSQMIRGEEGSERTAYYPTMSGNVNQKATISGQINAYDLTYNTKLSADGHLSFNKRYASEALDTDDRTNIGTETNIYGAFNGSNGPQSLDLRAAEIEALEYINDICISYLVPTNYLKYLMIPETSTSNVKETPSYFIQHNLVKEICIPSNIEVIRTHFAPSVDHVWTTGYKVGQTGGDIKGMRYDNGAWETASTTTPAYGYSDYTFGANRLYPHGTYTFSSNLKMIESNAFSNTTPHVRDVYVLAKKAPECHVDAFCTAMYIGNSGFAPSIVDGVITRDSYVNGSNWIAMLHYPRECLTPEVQRYTDPTRNYSVASNEVDGRGGVLYYPSYGEFLAAYAQGTTGYLWNAWDRTYEFGMLKASLSIGNTGWTLKNQQDANAKFLANPDLTKFPDDTKYTCTSFYDVTAGGTETQPNNLVEYYKVHWNEKVLSNQGAGFQLYPQANTSNTEFSFNVNTNGTEDNTSDDTKVTSRDYRGWHQFVLNAFAANTDIPMQPSRSYQIDNDWWTICLPYSLTYNEVMLYYGDVADDGKINDATKVPIVCLLSNVIRDKANDHITLNFSSNLMTHKATRTDGEWVVSNTAPNHEVAKDTEHNGTADIIIHAGVPYMIKPYFSTGAKRVFDVYAPGQTPSTNLSDGRIRVSATAYPGLYEKLKYAENVAGENFRKVQEDSLYTVPALILKENAASSGENYDSTEEITYNGKTYYRSTDYDYTFVGALQKNIIPPFSYFLGYKKKSLFVYADYLTAEFEANKKATTPDYKNTMKWTNNSCVICPNFLGSSCKSTQADSYNKYNLKKGSHNGLVTQASGTGDQTRPAQWIIYGTSSTDMTAILADDRFPTSGAGSAKGIFASSGLDINYGYDMEFSTVTAINGVQDNSTQEKVKDGKVYTIDGRYAGDSLESLNKGVYIMNGKKFIVK